MSVSRNAPCPCNSGKRYKHCCGQQLAEGDSTKTSLTTVESATVQPLFRLAPLPALDDGRPVLSIVMPWYRKLLHMRRVLPINALYFARPGIEVVLVMDEPSDEKALLELLRFYPEIRWQVVVNDQPHDWRPPCCAINVGIRHAQGDYVLVMSPESACVTDVPAAALRTLLEHPQGVALGQVGFACYEDLQRHLYTNPHLYREHRAYLQQVEDLANCYQNTVTDIYRLDTFYGSICAPRATFMAVQGYDESFTGWGGDDDNLRVRMELAGYQNLLCPQLRLLHLDDRHRTGGEQYDPDDDFVKCAIDQALANNVDWGKDFDRLAYRTPAPQPEKPGNWQTGLRQNVPYIEPVLAGSRRRCSVCGSLLHYSKKIRCRHCAEISSDVCNQHDSRKVRIACLIQVHNESEDLPGCLQHLSGYVDGIIALDDGSTDATPEILAAHPAVVACIGNPVTTPHTWNETDNRRRLLQQAQDMGYDWVLTCDADERFETLFLQQLHELASCFAQGEQAILSLSLRELWDHPLQYRVDGVWGRKQTGCFFTVPSGEVTLSGSKALHGDWFVDVRREGGKIYRARFNKYHLKMIEPSSRVARRDLYKRLDPEGVLQAEGYDYLSADGSSCRLDSIEPTRSYDLGTLNSKYQELLPDR